MESDSVKKTVQQEILTKVAEKYEEKLKTRMWMKRIGIILLLIVAIFLSYIIYKKVTKKTITIDLDFSKLGLNSLSDISPFAKFNQ